MTKSENSKLEENYGIFKDWLFSKEAWKTKPPIVCRVCHTEIIISSEDTLHDECAGQIWSEQKELSYNEK